MSSFCQITSMTITLLNLDHGQAAWNSLWPVIALMKGLNHIKVMLVVYKTHGVLAALSPDDWIELEDELLEPLKKLDCVAGKRKPIWELILPYQDHISGSCIVEELMSAGWTISRT